MKIFDGVPIKQPPSPFMQNAISIAMLLGRSFVEADKCRQARLANAGKNPTTLDDVMEKSGLKIPGLQEMLEQLMGGTDEAKKAASMIADNPDPMVLLQKFVAQFGMPANTGSVVTPPPDPHAAVPAGRAPSAPTTTAPTPPAEPTQTWPTPPAPTMTAAPPGPRPTWMPPMTPPSPPPGPMPTWPPSSASTTAPGLPKFRPDFTREALEAARAAGRGPTPTSWFSAGTAPSPSPSMTRTVMAEARPSLVAMVEQRLGVLHRRMQAHELELDLRLKRAEDELAKLRQELHELRSGKFEPAPDAAPSQKEQAPAAASIEADDASEAAEAASVGPEAAPAPEPPGEPHAAASLPVAATEQEVARAVELIGEFTEMVDQHHAQNLVRVVALEQEISAMRALVERECQAAKASIEG